MSTGWEARWSTREYFGAYPTLAAGTVERALGLGVRGIGLDTMGIDPMDDLSYENHLLALGRGCVIVENLCGLVPLRGKLLRFAALPLKYIDADGAPVRAVAMEE